MNKGLLLLVAAVIGTVWYFRRNARQTPLQMHYAELEANAEIGSAANAAAYISQPPLAMLGEGWATTVRADKNSPYSRDNLPGPTRFGFRFAQP